ncbi:CDP-alcohol phosphatidyltransferase family protein [Microbacterium sp. BWT-B31]|uniref:CDP-alcohol phosphatidyltransferase family protein n=1 Tax=Microbacterium sp. BWT-B31 TaxID=3232072 RepID=UPI003528A386
MQKVHLAPLWSVGAGVAGLIAIDRFSALSVAGWCIGLAYLLVSNALLARGLRRRATVRFGPANAVTLARSTLVGLIAALVATSFTGAIAVPLLIALTVPALALDGIDGWVARRTRTVSELGGRFDMEVDAFLLLVLSAYVAPTLGWWTLTIGLLRYAFVAAGLVIPAMRATLPYRYWRKVVTAVAGVALTIVASGIAPREVDWLVTLIALALLLESFGRDVVWLVRRRAETAGAGASGAIVTSTD